MNLCMRKKAGLFAVLLTAKRAFALQRSFKVLCKSITLVLFVKSATSKKLCSQHEKVPDTTEAKSK